MSSWALCGRRWVSVRELNTMNLNADDHSNNLYTFFINALADGMRSESCQQSQALDSTLKEYRRSNMWRRLENLIQKVDTLRYRRGVERALALHLRGEVRGDGLQLYKLTNSLEIGWRARDVHPWDRDDPPDRKALRFVRQSLADTEAAITRLFQNLPQVDVIALTVLDRNSENVIMTGTVHRTEAEAHAYLSAGMRLWMRGVKYHSDGQVFEPLSSDRGVEALMSGAVVD